VYLYLCEDINNISGGFLQVGNIFLSKGKEFLDNFSGHLLHGLREWHVVCFCLTPVGISTQVSDY